MEMSFDQFLESNGWVCTDPDNLQFRREESKNVFEFRQFSHPKEPFFSIQDSIDKDFNGDKDAFFAHYWNKWRFWNSDLIVVAAMSDEEKMEALTYAFSEDEAKQHMNDAALIAEYYFESSF